MFCQIIIFSFTSPSQEVDYECLELSTDPPHLLVALVCEAAGDTEETGAKDNVI